MSDPPVMPDGSRISEREGACLRLRREHLSAKEIALRLDLSPNTVSDHLKSATRKLQARSSMDAAERYEKWRNSVAIPQIGGADPPFGDIAAGAPPDASGPGRRDASQPAGRVLYGLTIGHRLGWIVAALAGIAVFVSLGAYLATLGGIYQAPRPPSQQTD